VFIFFNQNPEDEGCQFATDFYSPDDGVGPCIEGNLEAYVGDPNRVWPTTCVAGFWVDPDGTTSSDYGSYDEPFAGFDEALNYLVDGSRVNFHPGQSDWNGTISTKLLLRAPLGSVTIGDMP
jgi:hypothetical protein